MSVNIGKLIKALRRKRDAEGLSLRKLAGQIGVSFSTLARIERGEGEPDNNSLLRIIEWLGVEGEQAGLNFENVAFVHFRAVKNVSSATTECLLQVANAIKRQFKEIDEEEVELKSKNYGIYEKALSLSKTEMEEMAEELRAELKLQHDDALDALSLRLQDVDVIVPEDIEGLSDTCIYHLTQKGVDDWSAMSVPLGASESRWAIFRNNYHSVERQRVTYLEECWHILLGHKLTKIAKIGGAYGRTFEGAEEHDAFYLASASLLPEKAVRKAVAKGMSANEIGVLFGSSSELVEYRIKRLGLWRIYRSISVKLSNE